MQVRFAPWFLTSESPGAFFSEKQNATGDSEVDIYSLGASFAVAPGLAIKSDINFIDVDDPGTAADNEGYTFVLSVQANF